MDQSGHIPSIDISPFLGDSDSSEASQVINAVRQACKTTGFFQITGHGIPEMLQEGLLKASKKLFDLPMNEKAKLDATNNPGRRGYDMLETQTLENDSLPDLKEGFFVGHEVPLEHPLVRARRFGMGPNVWPEETVLPSKDFREPILKYHAAVNALAIKMLDLIARTLPYGPGVFSEFNKGTVVAPVRLLHYPPARKIETEMKQYGAGAHTDFGAVTLLLQDENSGLEVLHHNAGKFIPVQPTSNAFVINIGDMLSYWTGGEYKSSVHRVINRDNVHRYSAAFFYDGNLDCSLDPLDGSEPIIPDWTVEKHMVKRYKDSY